MKLNETIEGWCIYNKGTKDKEIYEDICEVFRRLREIGHEMAWKVQDYIRFHDDGFIVGFYDDRDENEPATEFAVYKTKVQLKEIE